MTVKPAEVLAILKKKPGVLHSTADILKALGRDPEAWEGRAAVIWAATKLEDSGQAKDGWVDLAGGGKRPAWTVEKKGNGK